MPESLNRSLDRAAFMREAVPLPVLLERPFDNSAPDAEANYRRLHDQRDIRIARVDNICRTAENDDRDLRASEDRECDRLRLEVDTIDTVLERVQEQFAGNSPEAREARVARSAHIAAMRNLPSTLPGGNVSVQRGTRALDLTLSDELVVEVRRAVQDHQTLRRSLADVRQAFGSQAATGPQAGRLLTYTTVAPASTPQVPWLSIEPTAPAGVVGEGQPKPEVGTTSLESAAIEKIAGYVDVSTEGLLFGANPLQAVETFAFRQLVRGENARVVAALATATPVAAATTPAQSILAGIGSVNAGGAVASVIAASAADIVAILGETSAGAGYPITGNATELTAVLWNTPIVFVAEVPAGTAYVWAQAGVGTGVAMGPSIVVDPRSQGLNNIARIIVEEFLGVVLMDPALAAKVDLVAP